MLGDEIVIEDDSSVIEQAEKVVISKNAEVLRLYYLETVPAALLCDARRASS